MSGEWTIYNTSTHPSLLSNTITSLLSDEKGGVWIGGFDGLVHLNNQGEWTIYSPDNSELPFKPINALMRDSEGGLWIGAGLGENVKLLHLDSNGDWNSFALPDNGTESGKLIPLIDNNKWNLGTNEMIQAFASDGSGGIWVGTHFKGLFHLSLDKQWTVFNISNSNLPNNRVRSLVSDDESGLWIANFGGLAHLTFSQKPFLCEKEKVPDMTDEKCQKLLKGSRSAILIHPNGEGNGYNQKRAIDNMATHIYQTLLYGRGYDKDEIYYVAYTPQLDFNGDKVSDDIVTAPVTLTELRHKLKTPRDITIEDIDKALKWAKERSLKTQAEGIAEEPLLIMFVGHGLPNNLVLDSSPQRLLNEDEIKKRLDDYTQDTGNEVIVMTEACHTGTLIDGLQDFNHIIITSTNDKLAYYSDFGRTSFTQFYFDELYRGSNYREGRQSVKEIFTGLRPPLKSQEPQLEDFMNGDRAKELCLNGCFGKRLEPELTPIVTAHHIAVGEYFEVTVSVDEKGQHVKRVWLNIATPRNARKRNEQGFETIAPFTQELSRKDHQWATDISGLTEVGEYNLFFKADYQIDIGTRTINAKKPIQVCVESCDNDN